MRGDKVGGVPTRTIIRGMFGRPTLEAGGDGKATWSQSLTPGTNRVAWAVKLDAGKQTSWNDYAKAIIPINEMLFTELEIVRLMSLYSVAVGADMAVTLYMHDPTDFDQYIELSHTPVSNSATGYRELNFPTEPGGSSWGWYGNVTDTPDTCPSDWDTSSYTWAQFQGDSVFRNWTIYRISLDYGYQTGNIVLNGCYLCQALINNVSILLEPSVEEVAGIALDTAAKATRSIPAWTFGEPTLSYSLNSVAYWARTTTDPRYHMSGAAWKACLWGRLQSGNDWAALVIPVNEMPISDFNTAEWTYAMTSDQTMGANIVFWCHDPDNFIYRAEITQDATLSTVTKTSGRNAHVFNPATVQMFYYGEITGTPDTCPTAGTRYTWAQFQGDSVFSRYTIYKITIEMGWEASGTFDQVWVGDLNLNGTNILLRPRSDADLMPVHTYYTGSGDLATTEATVAPKTPFKLLSFSFHVDVNPGQASPLVIQVLRDNDKHATYYDTVLHSSDIYVPTTTTSRHVIFGEGYEFAEDDVIDTLWTNNSKNYGIVYTWKPL